MQGPMLNTPRSLVQQGTVVKSLLETGKVARNSITKTFSALAALDFESDSPFAMFFRDLGSDREPNTCHRRGSSDSELGSIFCFHTNVSF